MAWENRITGNRASITLLRKGSEVKKRYIREKWLYIMIKLNWMICKGVSCFYKLICIDRDFVLLVDLIVIYFWNVICRSLSRTTHVIMALFNSAKQVSYYCDCYYHYLLLCLLNIYSFCLPYFTFFFSYKIEINIMK